MKKLFAILTALCLLCCSAAVLAEAVPATEAQPLYLTPGVTFGMSQDEVIKAHGSAKFERDVEHIAGLSFDELEYEDYDLMGSEAELHYYFMNNKLIGAQAQFDDDAAIFGKLQEKLTAEFGEGAKPDPASLGNALYALDDEGSLSANTRAWITGDTIIVLEQEDDGDVNLSCLNLAAEYVK